VVVRANRKDGGFRTVIHFADLAKADASCLEQLTKANKDALRTIARTADRLPATRARGNRVAKPDFFAYKQSTFESRSIAHEEMSLDGSGLRRRDACSGGGNPRFRAGVRRRLDAALVERVRDRLEESAGAVVRWLRPFRWKPARRWTSSAATPPDPDRFQLRDHRPGAPLDDRPQGVCLPDERFAVLNVAKLESRRRRRRAGTPRLAGRPARDDDVAEDGAVSVSPVRAGGLRQGRRPRPQEHQLLPAVPGSLSPARPARPASA
jgi:hypothetical protein